MDAEEQIVDVILTRVGSTMRVVDFAVFADAHAELADKYRSEGLSGTALDEAICKATPMALASVLYGITYH